MISDEPIFDKVLAEKHLRGWTYAKLAAVTGLTPRQVRSRIDKYVRRRVDGPR
jgi:DNA-directed RNA polymerase specialized sigma24 family protein